MKIILEQAEGEITEKKSRFIATMCPVDTKEQAEQFIAQCKKKYWDARHNCSAYVIGEHNEIMHSSDDGEPSGTAGRPMLSVLEGADLHNVAVVVTRYFGGVLLGTGGLVRAYQGAVSAAIANCHIEEQIDLQLLYVTVEYGDVGKIQYFIEQKQEYRLEETEYGVKVVFRIAVPVEMAEQSRKELIQLTGGKAEIEMGDVVASV
nr:YigZ family protein [Lachnospiraceae bacterium]